MISNETFSIRDKMPHILTTVDHRTAFKLLSLLFQIDKNIMFIGGNKR